MTLYSGCGNTFVLYDNRDLSLVAPPAIDCQKADGIIFLEESDHADYKMRVFNNDGRETEMCGNGIRCLIRFLEHLGQTQETFTIETLERTLKGTNYGELISIDMGLPTNIRWNEQIYIDNIGYLLHHLNTGVPHVVTFHPETAILDIRNLGSKIRHHPHYAPKGANVNFASIEDADTVVLRTYERGVENETSACGTGACATALAACRIYHLQPPIAIRTRSQEILFIDFKYTNDLFSDLTLTGPAVLV